MNAYTVALFVHFLSLLLACVASTLAAFGAFRLRDAGSPSEASAWLGLIHRAVPLFPVAVVGLLASGGYMTHARFTWTTPWIDAALIGLALIVSLGNGIEGSRARALERELAAGGLSPRARRLLRDPLSWSAKTTTLTLFAAVIFVMTAKPAATECAAVLLTALVTGVLAAVPLWRDPGVVAASPRWTARPPDARTRSAT